MMTVDRAVYRGATLKRVVVRNVTDETDDAIIAEAMRAAGESKSSLFGWGVQRHEDTPSTVVVTLHTD